MGELIKNLATYGVLVKGNSSAADNAEEQKRIENILDEFGPVGTE
jgi:hypothetical protein